MQRAQRARLQQKFRVFFRVFVAARGEGAAFSAQSNMIRMAAKGLFINGTFYYVDENNRFNVISVVEKREGDPMPVDFHADGKSDYGIYHSPNGNWYRMMSKDGFKTTQFGFSGTNPLGR